MPTYSDRSYYDKTTSLVAHVGSFSQPRSMLVGIWLKEIDGFFFKIQIRMYLRNNIYKELCGWRKLNNLYLCMICTTPTNDYIYSMSIYGWIYIYPHNKNWMKITLVSRQSTSLCYVTMTQAATLGWGHHHFALVGISHFIAALVL